MRVEPHGPVGSSVSADIDRALDAARHIDGWLTDEQARRLFTCARALPVPSRIVEIGSFHGRSTTVLGLAARDGVEIVAIDPHVGSDRGPEEYAEDRDTGDADTRTFRATLERAGLGDRVRHVRLRSQDALGAVDGPVDLLFVDGAHRYAPALDDLERWGARVAPGGTMLVHDAFSSIGVTLALGRTLFLGSDFAYTGRTGSLAEYRRAELRGTGRARNLLRQLRELPWFARNVLVKVAILTRLRRGDWPY
jgi:predicted O-methyltransferase YrrM